MHTTDYTARPMLSWRDRLDEWKGSLLLLPFCIWLASHRGDLTLIDNADLVFHEAGHFFARPLGLFAMFAGGTLMQLAVPLLLVWHFKRNDYLFGTQVSLLWLGQNLINVSVYAADARARQLPLLGGENAQHDWWTMLGWLNLLEYDQVIGWAFFVAALLVFFRALMLPRTVRVDSDWVNMA